MEFDTSPSASLSVLTGAVRGLMLNGDAARWSQPNRNTPGADVLAYEFPSKRGGLQVVDCGTSAQLVAPPGATCVVDTVVAAPERFITVADGFGTYSCGFATQSVSPRIQAWVDTVDDTPYRTTLIEILEGPSSSHAVRPYASSRRALDETWQVDFDALWFLVFEPVHAVTLSGISGADHAPPDGRAAVSGSEALTFYLGPESVAFEFVMRTSKRFPKGVAVIAEGQLATPVKTLTLFNNVGLPIGSIPWNQESLEYAVFVDEVESRARVTTYLVPSRTR